MTYDIIILRAKSVLGCAKAYTVEIDGFSVGKLANGETLKLNTVPGTHIISFNYFNKPETSTTLTIGKEQYVTQINCEVIGPSITLALSQPIIVAGTPSAIPSYVNQTLPAQKKRNGCLTAIGTVIACVGIFILLTVLFDWNNFSEGFKKGYNSATGQSDTSLIKVNPTKNGTTNKSTAKENAQPVPVFQEETKEIGDWSITLKGFEFRDSIDVGAFFSFAPEDGSKYAVATFNVTNNGKELAVFSPIFAFPPSVDVHLLYGEYTYTHSDLVGYDKDLTHRQLNPLESAEGIIVFAVPQILVDSEDELLIEISYDNKEITFKVR